MKNNSNKTRKNSLLAALFFLVLQISFAGNITGVIKNTKNEAIVGATVEIMDLQVQTKSDSLGFFNLSNIPDGNYNLTVVHTNYDFSSVYIIVNGVSNTTTTEIYLFEKTIEKVDLVRIEDKSPVGNGPEISQYMMSTDKTKIVIKPSTETQSSTKLDRGIIAPVSIMEYDGAGLQLGIGGRGLNPKRTAHYNTRQNGYDIAADALGYPETYYTPPGEALSKITIIRGAASLQFGPQFGGMIDFTLKDGPENPNKKTEVISSNKYGSFNQFHSFNSFATKNKKLKTYSFYHIKTGEGWRENSAYTSHTGYIGLEYMPIDALNIKFQLTHHQYTAQQSGGLTDTQFEIDPRKSYRDRNWFNVNWNILALDVNYNFDKDFWINSKTFGVIASRNSVGYLQDPSKADPGEERTLITGDFQNIGNETRIIRRYNFYKKNPGAFIMGVRLYKGWAQTGQGMADNTSNPIFKYATADSPENSKYTFPSKNLALFAEHSFHLNKRWSVTPGARFEFISTETDGYYNKYLIGLNGDTLDVLNAENQSKKNRSIYLGGLGVSYRAGKFGKLTANFSQNFRSVNFSDINIVIPNFKVDANIKDEFGHNIDLTFNKSWSKTAFLSVTGYYLYYANRIGIIWETDPETYDVYQLRTNVSASRTLGAEITGWVDLAKILPMNDSLQKLNWTSALTFTDAKYIEENTVVYGNNVEMVPAISIKSGIVYEYKNFLFSSMFNFQTKQFAEATNATTSSNGLYGVIPSFYVVDAKIGYTIKKITLQASVNNITNNMYFTQRATSYPGPGIIPSEGRSFFGTVIFKF